MERMAPLAVALLSLASLSFGEGSELRLMRHPALSKTQVVFAYAGDLWIASREGGDASRLTAGVGNEGSPFFSPDGKLVAFTGEYDGNVDVYTVPATGGVPKRLTYHAGTDSLAGWTPDGKQVLFVSQRTSYSGRFARLFTMPLESVFPSEVPLPMAYEGAYSPDGKRLAYTPIPRAVWNDSGSESDAGEPILRIRRRLDAVDVSPRRRGTFDRKTHLGRIGGHRRISDPD